MPLKFTRPAKTHPLAKNLSDDALGSFHIGFAQTLEFGYYFAVGGVWRWVSVVTSGDRRTLAGHEDTEEAAVKALNTLYEGFLDAAGLRERKIAARRVRAPQVAQAEMVA
ncbi:hypothetical protein EON82_23710 [bacterium]|nr:MAG: hypothetical protein EON82_23710 [bacterium]